MCKNVNQQTIAGGAAKEIQFGRATCSLVALCQSWLLEIDIGFAKMPRIGQLFIFILFANEFFPETFYCFCQKVVSLYL